LTDRDLTATLPQKRMYSAFRKSMLQFKNIEITEKVKTVTCWEYAKRNRYNKQLIKLVLNTKVAARRDGKVD